MTNWLKKSSLKYLIISLLVTNKLTNNCVKKDENVCFLRKIRLRLESFKNF